MTRAHGPLHSLFWIERTTRPGPLPPGCEEPRAFIPSRRSAASAMARISLKKTLIAFCLGGLCLWIAACAVNPVSGHPELMLLSDRDEIRLGQQTDAQVVRQYGLYKDPKLTAYISRIGQQMARLSHRPGLPYHFRIVDASALNAFAVPGGYVYLTRGILAALNSEAELAGVVGHEIGHITARHSAQQYSRAQLAQLGMGIGMILSDTLRSLSGFTELGVGLLFLKFSRDNERQSDDLGVEYASRMGYDASRMANFFRILEAMDPGSDRSGLPGWFATHPNPADREEAVRERAAVWRKRLGLANPRVGRESYLRQIDGLVVGEDPRQGYVEGHVFYHPELRFQFPVPRTWKLNNSPAQVRMVSKAQDAAILFALAPGQSPRDGAYRFAEKHGARVIHREPIRVNGLAAYRLLSDIRTRTGAVRVLSYFIKMDESLYVFHGLSSPSLFRRYAPIFRETMGDFRRLQDPAKIRVRPDRIRILTTRQGARVARALRSLGVPEKALEETAQLNGLSLRDWLPAGTLVKVVKRGR